MLSFTTSIALVVVLLTQVQGHAINMRDQSLAVLEGINTGPIGASKLEIRAKSGGCCKCGEFSSPANNPEYVFYTVDYLLYHAPTSCATNSDGTPALMICYQGAGVYIASPTNTPVATTCVLTGQYADSIYGSCNTGSSVQGQICDDDGFCVIVAAC